MAPYRLHKRENGLISVADESKSSSITLHTSNKLCKIAKKHTSPVAKENLFPSDDDDHSPVVSSSSSPHMVLKGQQLKGFQQCICCYTNSDMNNIKVLKFDYSQSVNRRLASRLVPETHSYYILCPTCSLKFKGKKSKQAMLSKINRRITKKLEHLEVPPSQTPPEASKKLMRVSASRKKSPTSPSLREKSSSSLTATRECREPPRRDYSGALQLAQAALMEISRKVSRVDELIVVLQSSEQVMVGIAAQQRNYLMMERNLKLKVSDAGSDLKSLPLDYARLVDVLESKKRGLGQSQKEVSTLNEQLVAMRASMANVQSQNLTDKTQELARLKTLMQPLTTLFKDDTSSFNKFHTQQLRAMSTYFAATSEAVVALYTTRQSMLETALSALTLTVDATVLEMEALQQGMEQLRGLCDQHTALAKRLDLLDESRRFCHEDHVSALSPFAYLEALLEDTETLLTMDVVKAKRWSRVLDVQSKEATLEVTRLTKLQGEGSNSTN